MSRMAISVFIMLLAMVWSHMNLILVLDYECKVDKSRCPKYGSRALNWTVIITTTGLTIGHDHKQFDMDGDMFRKVSGVAQGQEESVANDGKSLEKEM